MYNISTVSKVSVKVVNKIALQKKPDNFVNVFISVTSWSPPVVSYNCILHYFLTMSVGSHFNLTFGLKPEVGGIKIASHCFQTIHFPSWVAHSHLIVF